MLTTLAGIVLTLHGLVHLWFMMLALRLIPFEPDMGWTGYSWAFSRVFKDDLISPLAGFLFGVVALGFIISGILYPDKAYWVDSLLLVTAILSSFVLVLFWDGSTKNLVQKGLIGLLINVVIILLTILQ